MALGNTNISIAVVQNAIGVHSTSSLGALIALAQSGGVGGYAFYINETYGSTGYRNGNLINGALPYWNLYSPAIPAEWFCNSIYNLDLRLRRNALNANGGYDFRLHDFRGYEHNSALAPKPLIDTYSTNMQEWEGAQISITARFYKFFIDLATANRVGTALTHYKIRFTIGGVDYDTPAIPLDNSGEDVPTYTWTTGWSTSKVITVSVLLLPATLSMSQIVYLPTRFFKLNGVDGANQITVTIVPYPRLTIDATAIYPFGIPYLTDYTDYDWDTNPDIQGACFFTDAGGNVIPEPAVMTNGVLLQSIPVKFIGEYDGYVDIILYKNGVQMGNTISNQRIMMNKTSAGWTKSLNFGVSSYTVTQGDVFHIGITEA